MFDGAIASGFSKYYGNCKKVKHHSLTRKVYMTFRHCSKTWAKWILGLHGTFKWSPHFSTFNVFARHTIIYTTELLGGEKKKEYISMHWPHRKYPGQTLTLFCPLFEPGPTTEHAQYTPPVPERSCSRQDNYEEPVTYLTNGKLTIKGIDCTSFSQRYNRPSVSRQCTQIWQQEKKQKHS